MRLRHALLPVLLASALAASALTPEREQASGKGNQPDRLTSKEFSRLISETSEEGGYFRSDNLISNETPYLLILDKLKQLGVSGGAYIGVAPEQNFTYIAKIRPRIAFIVDIRHLALIQHLMYKAIFQLSPSRAAFLSLLLSKPLGKEKTPGENASIQELVDFFTRVPAADRSFRTNLSRIQKLIVKDYQYPLSAEDKKGLEYVYGSFFTYGLNISYASYGNFRGGRASFFPTLGELLVQTDLNGKTNCFLATDDDYQFVRGLHERNLIIPVTGDFAAPKALASVGDYLRKHGYTVSAFYTSNVEQYLFDGGSFPAFAKNVKQLPVDGRSVFIRSVSSRYAHPMQPAGHRSTTLLEQIQVFVKDFDEGRYSTYYDLISTHYIAPDQPKAGIQ